MIELYLLSVAQLFEETIFEAACKKLDAGRLEKVEKAKRREDKILRVGAGLLLQYAVQKGPVFECGPDMARGGEALLCNEISVKKVLNGIREPIEFDFSYGPHGKPYFKKNYREGKSDLFFSLSHSGDYVLCAISDVEIGADIQKIPEDVPEKIKREEDIAVRFFADAETIWYQQCGNKERRMVFYRLWAAKEAYMKMTGKGLTEGLSTFSVNLEQETVTESACGARKGNVYGVVAPEGYAAAICTKI